MTTTLAYASRRRSLGLLFFRICIVGVFASLVSFFVYGGGREWYLGERGVFTNLETRTRTLGVLSRVGWIARWCI